MWAPIFYSVRFFGVLVGVVTCQLSNFDSQFVKSCIIMLFFARNAYYVIFQGCNCFKYTFLVLHEMRFVQFQKMKKETKNMNCFS